MSKRLLQILAMVAACGCSIGGAAEPIELSAFQSLSRPKPDVELPYGMASSQSVDIFLPSGVGPHPVAILIHGGCWSRRTAGREQLRHMGAELAARGIAVWSIGYRRADEAGGGFPGTFVDVARAIDLLKSEGLAHGLDLTQTVAVGHSAGGHLALWSAARGSLPKSSALHVSDPFIPQAVISLAGVGDLRTFSRFVPLHCGPGVLERLAPPEHAERLYPEISPAAMPSMYGRITLYSGVLDRLVPPYVAYEFAAAVKKTQAKHLNIINIPDAGHFDFVTPGTSSWVQVLQHIENELAAAVDKPRMGREY